MSTDATNQSKEAQSKETYVEQIEDGLKTMGDKLAQLKQKAERATGDVQAQLQHETEVLTKRYEAARDRLVEVKNAGGDAWQDLEKGCSESWQRFKTACETAWSRFGSQ